MKTFLDPILQMQQPTDEEVEMFVHQSKEAAKSMLRQGIQGQEQKDGEGKW